jgi:adenylate cyclase
MTSQVRIRRLLFLAVGSLMIALCVAAYLTHFSSELENQSVDARFKIRGEQKPPSDIVVVDIDDETFHTLKHRWPFPRAYHAAVANRLAGDGATVIAFDIQFTEPSELGPEDDNALILACRHARTCVFADTEIGAKGQSLTFGGPEGLGFARAQVGDSRVPQDKNGVYRHMAYDFGTPRSAYAVQVAEKSSGRKIEAADMPDKRPWIDYYGPVFTFKTVQYARVCDCGHAKKDGVKQIAPGFFKGKTVIIGSSSPVLQDIHPTPWDSTMGGPEIQANAIATAREGFPLDDSPKWLDILLIVLMGAIAPLFGLRLKLWALAIAGVVGAIYTVATQVAFNSGEVLSYVYPMASLVLSSAGSLSVHYVTEAYERARVRENFARFVPESVVGQVLEQADGARLGGVGRYATVMFSDLRGFTSFAEQLEPDQVIRILNRYLTAMVDDAIIPHGGTLVDYMGDGIMAVFGAPIEMPDHADRALAAARAKLQRLEEFNDWMHAEYGFDKSFRMGIGLNSGQVMSGNVGSEQRLAYTAIGDTTNTAARLEGMTKGTDFMLFMSESTKNALSEDPLDVSFVGDYEIRGRVERLSIWSVDQSRKEKEDGGSFASVAQTETLADK